ncbi:MAG: class I SAM-dependent methyltransferase [bacterium]
MELWDFKASFYSLVRSLPPWRTILNGEKAALKRLIKGESIQPSVVLDVGTGAGSSLDVFRWDVSIIGLDRSFRMLKRVRRGTFTGVTGDANRLPFRDGAVPFVAAVGLTEYLSDKEEFVAEMRRVLHRGGFLLVTIAPPVFWNALRNGCGNRVYPIRPENLGEMMDKWGFVPVGQDRTFMQMQYLYRVE